MCHETVCVREAGLNVFACEPGVSLEDRFLRVAGRQHPEHVFHREAAPAPPLPGFGAHPRERVDVRLDACRCVARELLQVTLGPRRQLDAMRHELLQPQLRLDLLPGDGAFLLGFLQRGARVADVLFVFELLQALQIFDRDDGLVTAATALIAGDAGAEVGLVKARILAQDGARISSIERGEIGEGHD